MKINDFKIGEEVILISDNKRYIIEKIRPDFANGIVLGGIYKGDSSTCVEPKQIIKLTKNNLTKIYNKDIERKENEIKILKMNIKNLR